MMQTSEMRELKE